MEAHIGRLSLDDTICEGVISRMQQQLAEVFANVTPMQYTAFWEGEHHSLLPESLLNTLVHLQCDTGAVPSMQRDAAPPLFHVNTVTVVSAGQADPDGRELLKCGQPGGVESLLSFELEKVARGPPCVICGAIGVLLRGWLRRHPRLGDAKSTQHTVCHVDCTDPSFRVKQHALLASRLKGPRPSPHKY